MSDTPSHIELAYSAIPVFADDGTIDLGELNFLLGVALKDGEIDEEERIVLRSIFDKVSEDEVSPIVWDRISKVREQHGI